MHFSTKIIKNIHSEPLTVVIGSEPYRSKLLSDILSNENLFSKRFGRIIYFGERKYKSNKIELDESNYREAIHYEEVVDFLDDAKLDKIKNLLFVFNTKDIKGYEEIIEKLIGMRFSYLKGIVSILISIPSPNSISKALFSKFNTVFYLDTEHAKEICGIMEIKGQIPEKRRKDAYVFGNKTIDIYKEITD